MTAGAPNVYLTLNASGVIAPAITTIRDTVDVVARCLAAFEKDDFSSSPRFDGSGMEISFEPQTRDANARRTTYTHWVLSKGFHELAKGIRRSLEEAQSSWSRGRFEKDTIIAVKRVTRTTSYKIGSKVAFTAGDFWEIGMACWLFAQDLGAKLPQTNERAAA